ncbi:MAG: carbohydrate kinase family protein [Planctomycetales bacterium]|nr:carbohydrate kinase family protein [Planctomycetales bacterium]MCA9212426.1 carbohydrate kinase family protein [Planctomycetales bacterium]
MVSGVGSDHDGDTVVAELKTLHADVSCVQRVRAHTIANSILVMDDSERTILKSEPCEELWHHLTPNQQTNLQAAARIIAGGTLPSQLLRELLSLSQTQFFYLNPTRLPEDLTISLASADVVQVSRSDSRHFAGKNATPDAIACQLFAAGAQRVVVTDGARGATYFTSCGEAIHVAAPDICATRTTGAGDTFAAAACWAIGRYGLETSQWLRFAVHAAAFFAEAGSPGSEIQIAERFSCD